MKRRLTLIVILVVPLHVFAFVALFQAGRHRYNFACSTCHEMREMARRTGNSTHPRLKCADCHKPLMPLSKMFALQFGGEKSGAAEKDVAGKEPGGGATRRCKNCHLKEFKKEYIYRGSILFSHERHSIRAPGCAGCHAYASHPARAAKNTQVAIDTCRDCHKAHPADRPHPPGVIPDLHVYEKQPHPANWIITHKTDGAKTVRNCADCHKDSYCKNCHTKFIIHSPDWLREHGAEASEDLAPCQVCHLPEGCADCHNDKLPKSHGPGWSAFQHSKDLEIDNCMPCHRLNLCISCHVRSRPSSHTDTMIRNHAGFSKGKEKVCALCHEQNSCMNCHKIEMPHPANWPSIHAKKYKPEQKPVCANCHDDKYCAACHEKKIPASHADRGGWKKLHGKSASEKRSDCGVCHARYFCVSCHNLPMPHPKDWPGTHSVSAAEKPDSCAVCHKKEYCLDCHKSVKPKSHSEPSVDFIKHHGEAARKQRGNCEVCHDGKSFCENCHGIAIPHGAEFLNRHRDTVKNKGEKFCARCHAKDFCADCHKHRAKHSLEWIKSHGDNATADSKRCLTCHEPADCLACHSKPVRGAKGAHPDCAFCHDEKTMKFAGVGACGDCHDDVKKQTAAIEIKEDCTICHKPHGWKVEGQACDSCHDVSKRELHAKSDHSVCGMCHKQHDWKHQGRDTCFACHVDKKDHNSPELCLTCHPFK